MTSQFTPHRVVCLQPSATLTMRDIGMLDRVVACTKYCAEVCPEVADGSRRIVSDSWTAQAEEIRAAQAGLGHRIRAVSGRGGSRGPEGRRSLSWLRALVRLHDIYADIAAIAAIMSVPERGEQVIRRHAGRHRSHPLNLRWQCGNTSRVLRGMGQAVDRLPAMGRRTDRMSQAGTLSANPAKPLTAEDVARAAPDVLLAAWCGAGDRVPLEKIVQQRAWNDLPAVRNGRVFCISDELLNTPASNLVQDCALSRGPCTR